jgi:hypothetical protein
MQGRMNGHWCRLCLLTLALAACEHVGKGVTLAMPSNQSARLDVPDPEFRLTAEQRSKVQPGFDVNALERLLATLHPDLRMPILSDFQIQEDLVGGGIVKFEDPVLQALLEEVWAPRWEKVPDEWLDDEDSRRFPGRNIAKMRRAARGDRTRSDP